MGYDLEAATYDARLEGDAWMRACLWGRYLELFAPGSRVLDVGCGTGIDALYLASQGIRVTGIDASPAMVDEATTKLAATALRSMVDLRVLDVGELGSQPSAQFDGIIAAFASLSTVPDLQRFGLVATRLLRPHGRLVLHLLNRWSLWEWLGLIRAGRVRAAWRLRADVRDFVIGERISRHYLWSADGAYRRFFARHFRLRRRYGLGIVRPPHTVRRVPPPVVRALDHVEHLVRHRRPFLNWGRFFVLELEMRS